MTTDIRSILLTYWGHSEFRPLQEEIIHSVLKGNDTLALLPTGGGKSVCFQVPALAKKGICIVISPLVALMKDQVQNLKKKDIKAIAIYSGMDKREIDIALDYCVYGDAKFLYVSPERLTTEIFKVRFKKMNVSLIAVDEAHCISQWGYDFRPPYLQIAELRKMKPEVPLIALTATATKEVVADIQTKLDFKKENVFRKSFERKNLAYVVRKTENKLNELINICNKLKGSGVVYVNSRRRTFEIADLLVKNKITAEYYHAGLTHEEREKKQAAWIDNQCRIMVATNAFGMGIDKSDVRFVVHMDMPDTPEAYFQEAGRAGRDEKKAYAVLLYNDNSINEAEERFSIAFPPKDFVRKVYLALGNYFRLAVGSGKDESFIFDLADFSKKYSFQPVEVLNALKILELDNLISVSESMYSPSRIKIEVNNEELYSFQVKNPRADAFIKLLLRSYSGLFDEFVKIREEDIARKIPIATNEVVKYLQYLQTNGIIKYLTRTELPSVTFTTERIQESYFRISRQAYEDRKKRAEEKLLAIKNYIKNNHECRSRMLLAYFDEYDTYRCGHCDYCVKLNKLELSNVEFEEIESRIALSLNKGPKDIHTLYNDIGNLKKEKFIKVVNWMVDNEELKVDSENRYFL